MRKKIKKGHKSFIGNKGYVYILSNPSMKKMLKIGLTQRNIYKRVQELNGATGVPTPFKIEYFVETNDCKRLEKEMHQHFSKKRANKKREFFYVRKRTAKKTLDKYKKIVDGEKSNFVFYSMLFLIFILTMAIILLIPLK